MPIAEAISIPLSGISLDNASWLEIYTIPNALIIFDETLSASLAPSANRIFRGCLRKSSINGGADFLFDTAVFLFLKIQSLFGMQSYEHPNN
ncbi:Uncharacterised protein [Citrobacter freundii]|nr:Uncharacterised protein [Citrobacter freundii]